MKKAAICIIFVFAAVSFSFAMEKDEPIFKRGVRPMGMGGAFVAVSDDENAAFYNPAGITQRQSWFLSLLGFGASVSNETINIVTDAIDIMDDMGGGDDGLKMDDIKKVKKVISGKDVDLKLTSLFLEPFFLSSPKEIGPNGNTLSWGLGVLSSLDVGVNFMLDLPEYVLDLAEVAQKNPSELDINKVIEVLPPDILQDFGSNLTIPQLSDLLKQIANGGISGDQAAQQIYDSLDTEAKQLIDDLRNGDKKLEDVIEEIETKLPALKEKLLGSVGAKGIVNTYATITFDVPLAYRFKSLDAIKMPGELSVGANIKVIERFKAQSKIFVSIDDIGQIEDNFDMLNVAGLSGTGFGLDLGTIYHYTPQWNFGLQISDIFTRINYTGVLVKYPEDAPDSDFTHTAYIAPQFNIGAAYTPTKIIYGKDKYFETKNRFTFAADLRDLFGAYGDKFGDKIHIGAEYRFSPFALRLGLNKFRPTFGAGLEAGGFQLSYAFYGDRSYLAKALGEDKTVYYHEFILSVKLGYHDGRPFGSDIGRKEREAAARLEKDRIDAEKKAEKERIAAEKKEAKEKAAAEKAAAKAEADRIKAEQKAQQEAEKAAAKEAANAAQTAVDSADTSTPAAN